MTLEEIKTRRKQIREARKKWEFARQELHKEDQSLARAEKIAKKGRKLRPIDVRISDHALVRWLERVHGVDIDKLRELVLTKKQIDMVRTGAHKIKTDRYIFIIENNTVVTVLPKGGRK